MNSHSQVSLSDDIYPHCTVLKGATGTGSLPTPSMAFVKHLGQCLMLASSLTGEQPGWSQAG